MNFKRALFISVLGHCCLLAPLGSLWFPIPDKKSDDLKVVYYKITPPPDNSTAVTAKKAEKKEESAQIQTIKKAEAPKKTRPAKIKAAHTKPKEAPTLPAPPVPAAAKDNIVPPVIPGTNFPYTPECLSYYKYIREEIRSSLKQRYSNNYNEGLVDIRFEVDRTGELLALNVVKEKSSYDVTLYELTCETIKKISPFKPFPKGISQTQLNFHYQVEFKHR